MLVTIHGLPVTIKYHELKVIIRQECKIADFILDNLVGDDDGFKKVRVGLADDMQGAHVIKCLDGYRLSGYILRVTPVGKSGVINQAQSNQRGFQPQGYQGQPQNEYGQMDQPRVDPWSNNQWTGNQHMGQQNTYTYQQGQQMNTYTTPNQQIRPQFDQRQSILSRIGPPSQGFVFDAKNNIPKQTLLAARQGQVLRTVELVDTPQLSNRQMGSSYDLARERPELVRERSDLVRERPELIRERPDMARNKADMSRDRPDMSRDRNVIIKDYEGRDRNSPQQSLSNYEDRNPWAHQGHQKSIDDRKFPLDKREPLIKHAGTYKEYEKGQLMPQSRGPRDMGVPGRNISPSGKRILPSGREISPTGRRISPPVRHLPQSGRVSPCGRRASPPARRNSPPGRRISPPVRRISPSVRRISPSVRRISPSVRRISPHGRHISPHGRRISPSGRHLITNISDRHSPGRRDEGRRPQGQERYSPSHIVETRPAPKQVRPAYEPPQASNQTMYSGGYRPNMNENDQYSQGRQERSSRWSDREKPFIKHDDDRREPRISKFESSRTVDQSRAVEGAIKRPRSQNRDSRSPKRDRSPIRDRYRRHSPSPRSPRRSWALEKRRSPEDSEIPPPPSWPGQEPNRMQDSRDKRQPYPERVDEGRPVTWELPKFQQKTEDIGRETRAIIDEKRHFQREPITVRKDLLKWKPIGSDSSKHSSTRYNQDEDEKDRRRNELESRQQEFRPQDDAERRGRLDRRELVDRHDHENRCYKSNYADPPDFSKIKEELSRRIEKKTEILKKQEELQKEIEDVYNRAVDFTKKAEMYKKGERRREGDYRDDRRRDELEPKHYDRYSDRFDKELHVLDSDTKKSYVKQDRDDFRHVDHDTKTVSQSKEEKACEEIATKLLIKYGDYLPGNCKIRVREELQIAVSKIFREMFGSKDVSFIEMIIKFNSKHDIDKQKIFDNVLASLPSFYRKRPAKDDTGIPCKTSKPSPSPTMTKDESKQAPYQIPSWDYSYVTANTQMAATNSYTNQSYLMTVPAFVPTYTDVINVVPDQFAMNTQVSLENDSHNLYLCKDDFQPINGQEANTLKEYLIQQMLNVTQTSQGWAPDFTLKGLQSPFRYEVETRNGSSKDWLLNLDFSELQSFNVLVYTKEELWYERAAVWLPGHSKCRNIEPLKKLKLQNRFLEGLNIGKWKLVKKIDTSKGTRIYVDMPPSSARALENHKMTLSYELQKVNVFLKAVAVDKNAFDAGLKEPSVRFLPAPQNVPMPSIQQNPNVVKFCFKGDKPLALPVARKIKDSVIHKLFQYHLSGGASRTDFTKYGFMTPGYFGVLPENDESKQWLLHLNIGEINRHTICIMGASDHSTRYIKMYINLPQEENCTLAFERLRNGNQGVKGINFGKWKNMKVSYDKNAQRAMLAVEMDVESVETITALNYQLDYIEEGSNFETLSVRSEYSSAKLEEMLNKYKEEQSDTYVVSNMDLASGSDSDDDVVCLD